MTDWDAEGRPAKWATTVEPEWDGPEREIMIARHELHANTCRQCGGWLPDELTDIDPDDWTAELFDHGHTVSDVWCRSCRARQLHEHALPKTPDNQRGTNLDLSLGRFSSVRPIPML